MISSSSLISTTAASFRPLGWLPCLPRPLVCSPLIVVRGGVPESCGQLSMVVIPLSGLGKSLHLSPEKWKTVRSASSGWRENDRGSVSALPCRAQP